MILARSRRTEIRPVSFLIGLGSAAFALTPSPAVKWSVAAATVLFPFLWWILSTPQRWVVVFFASAILLPPLPLPVGDSGPHPSLLFAGIGPVAGAIFMPRWRSWKGPLPLVFAIFTAALLQSVALAVFYSGVVVALGSLARVLLFAIGPYTFIYTLSISNSSNDNILSSTRLLFRMSILAALFACVDFYFQLPAPAGYGEQFVWLEDSVVRRAQGLFYEASTLGNFCAFFLVMVLAAFACGRRIRPLRLWELIAGGFVLIVALVLSYSRGSLLNVLCAGIAMLYVRRILSRRWLLPSIFCIGAAVACVYFLSPSFGHSYLLRLQGSVLELYSAPANVLSGRVANWTALFDFLLQNPWQIFLGVGYKTLPYSEHAGRLIIADNTYLDLLVETGLVGLGVFLILNVLILRSAFRAARSAHPKAQFLGIWIFCFWIGELVQMFSGDLITYWRVLPIYFWVLASAMRQSVEE